MTKRSTTLSVQKGPPPGSRDVMHGLTLRRLNIVALTVGAAVLLGGAGAACALPAGTKADGAATGGAVAGHPTVRTATADTLLSVLKESQPGDTVKVSGGRVVPNANWAKLDFAEPGVFIVAEDGAELGGWQGLKGFKGITFRAFKIVAHEPGAAIMIGGAGTERVVLEDTEHFAEPGVFGSTGGGVIGSGVTVRRAHVHDIAGGLSIQGPVVTAVIEDSLFERIAGDAIGVAPARGAEVIVRRNTIRDFRKPDPQHLDAIQLFAGSYSVLIEDNLIDAREGMQPQGVFTDGGGMKATIRRNAFLGTAFHGISLNNPADGSVIEDNFIQGSTRPIVNEAGDKYGVALPWIRVVGRTPNGQVIVRNNSSGAFVVSNTSVRQEGNATVKNAKPGSEKDYQAWLKRIGRPPGTAAVASTPDPDRAAALPATSTR